MLIYGPILFGFTLYNLMSILQLFRQMCRIFLYFSLSKKLFRYEHS